jgi:hypothetical protein
MLFNACGLLNWNMVTELEVVLPNCITFLYNIPCGKIIGLPMLLGLGVVGLFSHKYICPY